MSNKLMAMTVLLFGGVVHAMKLEVDNPVENSPLTVIETWQDVSRFAGKFVAYTARTEFLDDTKYKYTLSSSQLSYAYINSSPAEYWQEGLQYTLRQLLVQKPNVQSNMKCLTNTILDQESLAMRDITAQEAKEILQAVKENKALFAFVWRYQERALKSQLQLLAEK